MFPVEQFALKMNISINGVSDIKTLLEYQDTIVAIVIDLCGGDLILSAAKLGVTVKTLQAKINASKNRSHFDRAHRIINGEVQHGHRKKADDFPCTKCGHTGSDRKHHYHHNKGYDPENYLSVEPLCVDCHGMERSTRTAVVLPGLCCSCRINPKRPGARDCRACHAAAESKRRAIRKEELERLRALVKEKT